MTLSLMMPDIDIKPNETSPAITENKISIRRKCNFVSEIGAIFRFNENITIQTNGDRHEHSMKSFCVSCAFPFGIYSLDVISYP